ncbi:MFS transporter [Halobacillus aidingensis]|uniref:Sugar phosphate permease n=1 Tax=Halobacillus aidingensis TaxID=240303 RepID=A0A1H0LVC3_HALAD|nr:MFS transporter [Halobacillus aidingensis]SDO72104.1 Sugar phosphate permease [Halobacillus aidingensis]
MMQLYKTLTKQSFQSNPWKMLVWLLIAQIMVAFLGRSLGPLGVLIGEDFELSKAQVGLLPSALFIGQALASVPAGFMVDRLGSRILLLCVAFCTGLSFMGLTLHSYYWLLLVLIGIGGVGYGAMHPTTNRGIVYWFEQKRRGTAMGIKQMGITLGSALAGLILLPMAVTYGWRPVLFIAAVLLVGAGMLSYFQYRDHEQAGQHEKQSLKKFYASLWSMTKNKPLLYVSLSALCLNGSQMTLNTYIVFYSHEKLNISLYLAGILFVVSEVSGSLGRVGWGVISDRFFDGRRIVILLVIAVLTILSSTTVALVPETTGFVTMIPIVAVFGFAISGFNGIWMNVASELVPKEKSGLATGFSIMLGSMGVIIIPPLFGLMVDVSGGYTVGWFTIAGLMIIVLSLLIAISLHLKKTNHVL